MKNFPFSSKCSLIIFSVAVSLPIALYLSFFDQAEHINFISKDMDDIAMSMMKGDSLNDPTHRASFPLILSFYYSLIDHLGLINFRYSILAVSNAVFWGTSSIFFVKICLTVNRLKQKEILSLRAILASVILFVTCYPLIQFQLSILAENFFCPLLVSFYYLCLLFIESLELRCGQTRHSVVKIVSFSILLGLISGVLYGMRPAILPGLALASVMIFYVARDIKIAIVSFVSVTLFFLIVARLVALENSQFDDFGEARISSNLGVNFALSWCRPRRISSVINGKTERFFSPPAFWNLPEESTINTEVSFRNQLYYVGLGIQCIGLHPERLVTNITNVKNLFNSVMYPTPIEESWHYDFLFIWKIITIVFLFWYALYPLIVGVDRPWILSTLFIVALLFSVFAFNPGEERYLPPFLFLIIIFAVASLSGLFRLLHRFFRATVSNLIFAAALFLPFILVGCLTWSWRVKEIEFKKEFVYLGVHSTLDWLEKNQKEDGSFPYYVDLSQNKVLPEESLVRQMVTSQGIANIARLDTFPKAKGLHTRNLKYLLSSIRTFNERAYFVETEAKTNSTNATAFATMALVDSPFRDNYRDTIRMLGQYFLEIQNYDGSFRVIPDIYRSLSTPELERSVEGFATGQVIAACSALYEFLKEDRFFECALKGYNYYSDVVGVDKSKSKGPWYLWHTIAYGRLFRITKNPDIGHSVLRLADDIYKKFQIGLRNPGALPGSFSRRERSTSAADAAFSESLAVGVQVAVDLNDFRSARKILSRMHRSLSAVNRQLVKSKEDPNYGALIDKASPDPSKPPLANFVRIDNPGHALMAWYNFLLIKGL